MKRLLKFRKQKLSKTTWLLSVVLVVVIASAFIVPYSFYGSKNVKAATVDELRAQANALQAQIDANNAEATRLAGEADTLQNKLAILNTQISQLQAQIDLTTTKINELQVQLEQAQVELDRQKSLLKASLQALYKKGGASTVELLVGSESFSQFINDQTYLEKLKTGIQDSTEKVIALKQQIQAQQEEQKALLSQQQSEQTSLNMTRAEQQRLLNDTQGREDAYRQTAADLRQQQLALLAQIAASFQQFSGDGTRGGYPTDPPWATAPQDSMSDWWGMLNRECVSYTAFKVFQSGRHMPYWGYRGNAADWVSNAYDWGIPVYYDPQPGDVAISKAGGYGHAMYVETVASGRIYVSQYNVIHGEYSEMWIDLNNTGWLGTLYFLRFP